jgi:hypothetical protein
MATCLLLLLNNNGISRNPNLKKRHMELRPHSHGFKAGSRELVPVGQAHTYRSDGRLTSQQLQSSLFTTSSILNDYFFGSLSSVDYQPQTASTSGDVRCPLTQL